MYLSTFELSLGRHRPRCWGLSPSCFSYRPRLSACQLPASPYSSSHLILATAHFVRTLCTERMVASSFCILFYYSFNRTFEAVNAPVWELKLLALRSVHLLRHLHLPSNQSLAHHTMVGQRYNTGVLVGVPSSFASSMHTCILRILQLAPLCLCGHALSVHRECHCCEVEVGALECQDCGGF